MTTSEYIEKLGYWFDYIVEDDEIKEEYNREKPNYIDDEVSEATRLTNLFYEVEHKKEQIEKELEDLREELEKKL